MVATVLATDLGKERSATNALLVTIQRLLVPARSGAIAVCQDTMDTTLLKVAASCATKR